MNTSLLLLRRLPLQVNANFQKTKQLTPEEFLEVIIWKSNHSKTNVVYGILASETTVGELMMQVADAVDLERVKLLDADGAQPPRAEGCKPH